MWIMEFGQKAKGYKGKEEWYGANMQETITLREIGRLLKLMDDTDIFKISKTKTINQNGNGTSNT